MKSTFIKFLFALPLFLLVFGSCTKMEYNYNDYLKREPYAPKVKNLFALNEYKAVTLYWELPESTRLKKIEISYDDVTIESDLVENYRIEDLLIKGYTFTVVTVDVNGFKSIPVTTYAFPSGE